MNINWYPGHMRKSIREMTINVNKVDLVAEIIDARIPISSRNPDLQELGGSKPHMIIMNRMDLASPAWNKIWRQKFSDQGFAVLETDAKSGKGTGLFAAEVRRALKDKIRTWSEKGMSGKPLRVMICGIPNVGKSSFINKVAGKKVAAAQNRPGVTKKSQWIEAKGGLLLMDTPGLLWPRINDTEAGIRLALTGAIKDEVLDVEELGIHLAQILGTHYPEQMQKRYHIEYEEGLTGAEILERVGRKRGFLISRGEVDLERSAEMLLNEYRNGKIGQFTLEFPMDQEVSNGKDRHAEV